MPFDLTTIPKVKLNEDFKNSAVITKKENRYYYLFVNKNQQMMYDLYTNKEAKEMYSSYDLGYGKILMGGLGFGILALWLATKPEVKHIHVIEKSQDVVDIFLSKNKLLSNITIEIADIETYKTEDKYDCILLDHYELATPENTVKSMKNIAKNIPNHDLFWIWSMENVFTELCYGETALKYKPLFTEKNTNFYDKWDYFKNEVTEISTIPDLTPEKLTEYIYTFIDLLDAIPSI